MQRLQQRHGGNESFFLFYLFTAIRDGETRYREAASSVKLIGAKCALRLVSLPFRGAFFLSFLFLKKKHTQK